MESRSRRSFLRGTAAAGAALFAAPSILSGKSRSAAVPDADKPFRLAYAPSIGMFRELCGSEDPLDNIQFLADKGFRALFDNGFPGRPVEEQERISTKIQKMGSKPYMITYSNQKCKKQFITSQALITKS